MITTASTIGHVEHVMGTAFSFVVEAGSLDEVDVRLAIDAACERLHEADDVFSTWKPDSPISRLRRGEIGIGDCPAEVGVVLDLCRRARRSSRGWFDPWAMPGGVDPTGLVKGWATQEALLVLKKAGVAAAMINGGGDIATFGCRHGGRPWVIGIRDPVDASSCVCVVASPGAVATSGSYERGLHVRDPRTGLGVDELWSVTVAGPDLALADALATGVMAGGMDAVALVEAIPGYSALVIDAQERLLPTDGVPLIVDGDLRCR
jgi:thiamine biosynthesis lipoprotein